MHKLLLKPVLWTAAAMIFFGPSNVLASDVLAQDQAVADDPDCDEKATVPAARDTASLEREWLSEHNKERARLGVKPLAWDAKLAAAAGAHAALMAKTDVYEHADQTDGPNVQGENMWMGTNGAYTAADMVGSWIAEKVDFEAGVFPQVSKTGNWVDIGHYTQLIWPETRHVGCALAGNARDEYVVCRYFPAGNVLGEQIGVK
jgi:uncharacterized protein YkwD